MLKYLAVVLLFLGSIGCKDRTLFTSISSDKSGINFNNIITDNDTLNVLDVENIYNGGGVGVADFNNDGLQDLYFTGNMVSNKLYLNTGNFRFKDITNVAGVTGEGRWSRGVSTVDINSDGLMDLYVCATLLPNGKKRENLLYVNRGTDNNGVPRFENKAAEYGLNDTAHSTMAAFFDYDNDGDLDMYLLLNEISKSVYPNQFRPILKNSENPNTDKLFRNDWNTQLQHPIYTNVSKEAGITIEGYGHGVNICDLNNDGWKDIYVTNDFLPNNILYINNKNGTYTDQVTTYFKHTSANSMGQDIVDINNDGLQDVIELDMNPEDNFRKKMMMGPNNYQAYQNSDLYGYQYQYVRNVLQINQGPRVLQNDSIGPPVFSDMGYLSGIAETDWSWTPLVTDFDNDGLRDIIITNGFPKDVTDHDFIAFRNKAFSITAKKDLLQQIPQVKVSNYAYKNKGNISFDNVTDSWGIKEPRFSSGAAYADLDNDGDQDVIINNINDEASVYRNNERELNKESSNYLNIKFIGDSLNKNGLGAYAEVFYNKADKQVWEHTTYRGYLSTIEDVAHFGLGKTSIVDSVIIKWPNGKVQKLINIQANQKLKVYQSQAKENFVSQTILPNTLFKEVTDSVKVSFKHEDTDFIDFTIQKLLPHKFSEYGPSIAVADLDGNGLDDFITGGSFKQSAQLFLQQTTGGFTQKSLLALNTNNKISEDEGMLLFDAEGDGDPDLYITSGGYESQSGSTAYTDKFYINDGKGNFKPDTSALPKNLTSKFCVRGADFDKDGDLDLFISGRVNPWNYPKPVSSFIYRNDSKQGKVLFTDVTASIAKDFLNIGLVCDALFTDFDNDGWTDLVLAGEWMPLSFFKNQNGRFVNVTASTGLAAQVGWWNTITAGDFDNDGDMDYIAGNLGENSFYKASDKYPVSIYADDFDNNGSYDAFPSVFLKTSQQDESLKEYPVHTREDVVKQMISIRSTFQNYRSYAVATMDKVLTQEQLKKALKRSANNFKSCYVQNQGNGKFALSPLPYQVQVSVLNGMLVDDYNDDGNLDVLINGNDFGTEVSVGRYDALNGLLLLGNGKGGFSPQSILQSGIFIPGNGKALAKLRYKNNKYMVAASQNRGRLKMFELKNQLPVIQLNESDASAMLILNNGKKQRQEFYYGASFLSQSSRFLVAGSQVKSVSITDNKGKSREVSIK